TIKKLKEELKSRNISYKERMDRDELVELLQEYMYKETLTKPLNDDVIVEEMELDSGKRLSLNVVEILKRFFIAGQEDPSNRYLAKDMLAALDEMVENGELTKEKIPTEKSID
ncbi:14203_t:CDS:2, partial [Gigaspora margarita]